MKKELRLHVGDLVQALCWQGEQGATYIDLKTGEVLTEAFLDCSENRHDVSGNKERYVYVAGISHGEQHSIAGVPCHQDGQHESLGEAIHSGQVPGFHKLLAEVAKKRVLDALGARKSEFEVTFDVPAAQVIHLDVSDSGGSDEGGPAPRTVLPLITTP